MIIASSLGNSQLGLGAVGTGAITPTEEAQSPGFVSIGQQVVSAENALQAAYTNISMLVQAAGPDATVPVKLLTEYNVARQRLVEAASDWMKARAKTPAQYLPDAGKEPEAPPAFVIPAPPISGFGEATVSARSVTVVYGPAGAERSIPLGSVEAMHAWPQQMNMSGVGLGNPTLFLFFVFGVAITGYVITMIIREWDRVEVSANRAKAQIAKSQTEAVEAASKALTAAYVACVGNSTDYSHRLACLERAQKATKGVIDALPKVPPTKTGLGFLGTVGLVLLAGAAGVGGYLYYQKRRAEG